MRNKKDCVELKVDDHRLKGEKWGDLFRSSRMKARRWSSRLKGDLIGRICFKLGEISARVLMFSVIGIGTALHIVYSVLYVICGMKLQDRLYGQTGP